MDFWIIFPTVSILLMLNIGASESLICYEGYRVSTENAKSVNCSGFCKIKMAGKIETRMSCQEAGSKWTCVGKHSDAEKEEVFSECSCNTDRCNTDFCRCKGARSGQERRFKLTHAVFIVTITVMSRFFIQY